jgi:hypothetical protein
MAGQKDIANVKKKYLAPAEAVAVKLSTAHARFLKTSQAMLAPPPPGLNEEDLAAHADYVKTLKKDLDIMNGMFGDVLSTFKRLQSIVR